MATRFCAIRSKLGTAEEWYEKTVLEDLLGVKKARLYRRLDTLTKQKERLCGHLIKRYKDWFGVRMVFLLYDVMGTFFEALAGPNPKAAHGYSRDKRSDCKQVWIGLVCTLEVLWLAFEIFAGNRKDVTTVEEIVQTMEEKYVLCRSMARAEEEKAMMRAARRQGRRGVCENPRLARVHAAEGPGKTRTPHRAFHGQIPRRRTPHHGQGASRHRGPGVWTRLLEFCPGGLESQPAQERVFVANPLPRDRSGRDLGMVNPTHRRRGRVPHGKERSGVAPRLPSNRVAG